MRRCCASWHGRRWHSRRADRPPWRRTSTADAGVGGGQPINADDLPETIAGDRVIKDGTVTLALEEGSFDRAFAQVVGPLLVLARAGWIAWRVARRPPVAAAQP